MGVQGPGPSLGLPTLRLGFRRTEGHDVVPQYRLTICSFAHFHNNAFAFNTLLKSPKHHLIFLQRQLERLWQLCCTRTRGILWWWRGTRQEWQCWATWAREGQEEGGEGQVWQKGWKQRGWQRWSASWWRRRRGWICRRRSRGWLESAEKGESATQGLHTQIYSQFYWSSPLSHHLLMIMSSKGRISEKADGSGRGNHAWGVEEGWGGQVLEVMIHSDYDWKVNSTGCIVHLHS